MSLHVEEAPLLQTKLWWRLIQGERRETVLR